MAKKLIKKPGRPAKPSPKQKVQKFEKGDLVAREGWDDPYKAAVKEGAAGVPKPVPETPPAARSGWSDPYAAAVKSGSGMVPAAVPETAPTARPGWGDPYAAAVKAGANAPPPQARAPEALPARTPPVAPAARPGWENPAATSRPVIAGGAMIAVPGTNPNPDSPLFARTGEGPSSAPGAYKQVVSPTQSPGLLSAEDAQAMANDALNTARAPSAPDANGWVTHKGPAPARLPSPGPTSNQGAFRADGSAIPVPSSKNVNTVSSGNFGALASGNTQADYDNALLRKWYSMSPNERGAMPASVMEAKHRGATPQDTAMNIARARIMESGLPPERISESLGKLEQIRAYLEAQTANAAHQGRQDTMEAARDAESGRHNQATEGLTREQQQTQAENQRGFLDVAQWNAAAGSLRNQNDAAFQQGSLENDRQRIRQGESLLLPIPAFDPTITEKSNPAAYKQMVDSINRMTAAHQDYIKLRSEHPGASPQELKQFALLPGPDGKVRAAAQAIDFSHYAGGGMVQSPVYGGPPSLPRIDPVMADYRQYVLRAQQQGVPTVPFAQFAQLKAGAFQGQPQQPVAMAKGGPVLSRAEGAVPAAGKMVIDTNPNAKTDSIPAVIDGKAPARLDSGEFVIPADVVRHYGTKFLHNLIEKANGAM